MFDVEDVLFEANGAVTVLSPGQTIYSFLLVNNGEIVESSLAQCEKSQTWVVVPSSATALTVHQNCSAWNGHLEKVFTLLRLRDV